MPAATIGLMKPTAQVSAALTTAQLFPLLSNPLAPSVLPLPGKLTLEGKRFRVLASGKATTAGATTTALVSLYASNIIPASSPLAAASWKLLGASTARVVNTTTAPWWIEASLIYDSIGGNMQGSFNAMVNNAIDASAAIANQLTGINGTNLNVTQAGPVVVAPQDPVAYFAAGITFGVAASASNIGVLSSLTIEY